MGVFKRTENYQGRLDWEILQNGWTSLYFNPQLLEEDVEWFAKEKFRVVTFDCKQWTSKETIHEDLRSKLDFPDYYGKNLSALNDCLWQLEINDKGLIVVFLSFELIDNKYGYELLDIFAGNSRQHFLFGEKLLTLVQVNDNQYDCKEVGACPVMWNRREWLNASRGL